MALCCWARSRILTLNSFACTEHRILSAARSQVDLKRSKQVFSMVMSRYLFCRHRPSQKAYFVKISIFVFCSWRTTWRRVCFYLCSCGGFLTWTTSWASIMQRCKVCSSTVSVCSKQLRTSIFLPFSLYSLSMALLMGFSFAHRLIAEVFSLLSSSLCWSYKQLCCEVIWMCPALVVMFTLEI
jgi:hypothetical protein